MPEPTFDLAAAHRYFAAHCFNSTWDLIELPERTPEQNREMVARTYASLYHWLNRPDCGPMQMSVAYWQISRVQALCGDGGAALAAAEVCDSYSGDLPPFYRGYAQEAAARAQQLLGNADLAAAALRCAWELSALVEPLDERQLLEADLKSLA